MKIEILKFISDTLETNKINYEFMEWTTNPVPNPYFVGEYTESVPSDESGLTETTFILTGTGKSWFELEKAREKIESIFSKVNGLMAILEKSGVAIFYENAFPVPMDNAELKRLQINLIIKDWSVM